MDPQFETEVPSSSHESFIENECESSGNGTKSHASQQDTVFDKTSDGPITPPCDGDNGKSSEEIFTKTPPRKDNLENSIERAKALIQEFEAQRMEQVQAEISLNLENNEKRSRSKSKSKSNEKNLTFHRRDRKIRNYRKSDLKSPSPAPKVQPADKVPPKREKEKTTSKYPKNWKEFVSEKWSFSKINSRNSKSQNSCSSITKQLLFQSPSELIKPFHFKAENGNQVHVPHNFIRQTTTKPQVTYNVNSKAIKDFHLKRSEVLKMTNSNFRQILVKFLNRSRIKRFKQIGPMGQRNWYQKVWKEDSKILETSMGLSFLRSYSDGEEEDAIREPSQRKKSKREIGEKSWTPERKMDDSPRFTPKKAKLDENHKSEVENLKSKKKIKKKKRNSSESEASTSDHHHKKHKNSKKKSKKHKAAEKLGKIKKKNKKEKKRDIEREILEKLKHEIELNLVKVKNEGLEDGIKTPELKNQIIQHVTPTIASKLPILGEQLSKCETPDTDEYHSNWESEEETVSNLESPVKTAEKKPDPNTTSLEMPLNIRTFTRRDVLAAPVLKPENIDVDAEFKRLEEERLKLSNERMRLELEKIKLREMEMIHTLGSTEITCNLEGAIFRKKLAKKGAQHSRWEIDDLVPKKSDKIDPNAFTISNSPEISSTKSPTPNVLENAYEEFMKAVSTGDESKDALPTSTNETPLPVMISPQKMKPVVDLQEFTLNSILPAPQMEKDDELGTETTKPVIFSSLVIPSKRPSVLEKTNWKVEEDSEEEATETAKTTETTETTKTTDETTKTTETTETTVETVATSENAENVQIEKSEAEPDKSSTIENSDCKRKRRSSSTEKHRKDIKDVKRKNENEKCRDSRRKSENTEHKFSQRRQRRSSLSPRRNRRRSGSPHRRQLQRLPRRHESSRRTNNRRMPLRKQRRSTTPIRSSNKRRSTSPKSSPVDELKKSVADSTISDDSLLPHPQIFGENSSSPQPSSRRLRNAANLSPKRPSLDERINQVLGIEPVTTWKPPVVDNYQNYHEYYNNSANDYHELHAQNHQTKVLQVGNILQVVPSEDVSVPPATASVQRILQVGNMLQIVPSELTAPPPLAPEIKTEVFEHGEQQPQQVDDPKQTERAKRKLEKLERKKERERRRKEREKKIKQKLKVTTEEMIKRALELEGFIEDEIGGAVVPEIISETPGIDASKSILRTHDDKTERKKSVQFADGVRPGDGTSPSGGEELSSPPPPQTDNLPKTKRFKKLEKLRKRKRRVKVKLTKSRSDDDSEDEYENLPPPSPPPGSPPPHVFPQRVKVHTINNIPQHYLPAYGVTTAPQQPQPQMAPFQIPPTAVYRTPTAPQHVIGQNFNRTIGVSRGATDQTYGTF